MPRPKIEAVEATSGFVRCGAEVAVIPLSVVEIVLVVARCGVGDCLEAPPRFVIGVQEIVVRDVANFKNGVRDEYPRCSG